MNDQAKKVQVRYQDNRILYLCPKCKQSVIFKRKIHGTSLCMRCGQRLDWSDTKDIYAETIQATDADEAAWLATIYYEITNTPEEKRISIDDWRLSLRGRGPELYFLFKDSKQYGKFMRRYAREGIIYDG